MYVAQQSGSRGSPDTGIIVTGWSYLQSRDNISSFSCVAIIRQESDVRKTA